MCVMDASDRPDHMTQDQFVQSVPPHTLLLWDNGLFYRRPGNDETYTWERLVRSEERAYDDLAALFGQMDEADRTYLAQSLGLPDTKEI